MYNSHKYNVAFRSFPTHVVIQFLKSNLRAILASSFIFLHFSVISQINIVPGIGVAVDDQNRTIYADPVTQTLHRTEAGGTTTLIASGKPYDHVDQRGASIMAHDENGDVHQYSEIGTTGTFTENFIAAIGDVDELEQDDNLIYHLENGEVYAGGTTLVTSDGSILDFCIGIDPGTQNTVMYTVSDNGSINYYSNVGSGVSPVFFDDVDGASKIEFDDTTGEIVVGKDNGDVLLYPTPGSTNNNIIGNVPNMEDLDYGSSEAHVTNGEAVTLPVELFSFTAHQNNAQNILIWTTGAEVNNDRFEVCRSTNAIDWKTIGKVKGRGDNSTYVFEDGNIQNKKYYYRLKQFDLDGGIQVHFIISVNVTDMDMNVYPNIVRDGQITFDFGSNEIRRVEMLDEQGQMFDTFYPNFLHEKQLVLDISNFSSGLKYARVHTKFSVINLPFVKI